MTPHFRPGRGHPARPRPRAPHPVAYRSGRMDRTPGTARAAAAPDGPVGPLRVLHVVESFGGGVYEVVRVLGERLAEREQAVAIAYGVRPETPPGVEATLDGRLEVFAPPGPSAAPAAQLAAYRAIGRLERCWQPDVVHLHSSFAGAVGSPPSGSRRPTVYSPHGYSFTMAGSGARRRAFRTVERGIARRVTAVGAVSPSEAALAARLGTARAIVTVPNGIPELDAPAERAADPSRPLLVVAMGRIMAQRRPSRSPDLSARRRAWPWSVDRRRPLRPARRGGARGGRRSR